MSPCTWKSSSIGFHQSVLTLLQSEVFHLQLEMYFPGVELCQHFSSRRGISIIAGRWCSKWGGNLTGCGLETAKTKLYQMRTQDVLHFRSFNRSIGVSELFVPKSKISSILVSSIQFCYKSTSALSSPGIAFSESGTANIDASIASI